MPSYVTMPRQEGEGEEEGRGEREEKREEDAEEEAEACDLHRAQEQQNDGAHGLWSLGSTSSWVSTHELVSHELVQVRGW